MIQNQSSLDDERNIEYFTKLIDQYGLDVRALDWGSKKSQEERFHILAQIGDLQGARILDVGCGLGDFYIWLRKNEYEVEYLGIDITPKMIEIASNRLPEAEFKLKNILEDEDDILENSFDFVFASGIFYLRQHDPYGFLKIMVRKLFAKCQIGLGFNSLSAWARPKDKKEFYADPLVVVAYCRELTQFLTLRHDYHLGDFTLYMYKKR
jgi:SAM-dependent methyltransferase